MDTSRQTQHAGGGYKKSWLKWAALYVAIGGIIYLIVYFVAFNGGGGGGGGGGY